MTLSKLFDPRDRADTVPPRFQFSDKDGSYSYVVSAREPGSGHYTKKSTSVPFGEKLIADFLRVEGGWLSYSPYDESRLVPLPYDAANALAAAGAKPGPDYVVVARLPVLLKEQGLAQWTMSGVIAQNAIALLRLFYQHATEAARGELPVIALLPSRQVEIRSRNNERHHVPVLEIIGWSKRDDDVFGPPIVTPPVPILPASTAGAALQLSSPPANDDTAPAAPQTSLTPPWVEQQVAAALPAATPGTSVQANDNAAKTNDVFANMTPVAANPGKPKF